MNEAIALQERALRLLTRFIEEMAAISSVETNLDRIVTNVEELIEMTVQGVQRLVTTKGEVVTLVQLGALSLDDAFCFVRSVLDTYEHAVQKLADHCETLEQFRPVPSRLKFEAVRQRLRDEAADLNNGWPWLDRNSLPKPNPDLVKVSRETLGYEEWCDTEMLLRDPGMGRSWLLAQAVLAAVPTCVLVGVWGAAAFSLLSIGPAWAGFLAGFLPTSGLAAWAITAPYQRQPR